MKFALVYSKKNVQKFCGHFFAAFEKGSPQKEQNKIRRVILQENNARHWYDVSLPCKIFFHLDCIHSAGIVHRDLTPSNILVGPNGNVKVTSMPSNLETLGQNSDLLGQVCDFGLSASYIKVKPEEGMHSYVVMRLNHCFWWGKHEPDVVPF